MKSIILSMFVLVFLASCSKDITTDGSNNTSSENKVKSGSELIKSLTPPPGLNDEALRIFNDVQDPDYVIAIIDNPNFGKFSSSPQNDIYIAGRSENNVVLNIEDESYTPDVNGQWLSQSIDFKEYFGKTIEVTLSKEEEVISSEIYVTEPILVSKLGDENTNIISRSGNELTWTPDPNNTSGYIALYYKLYNDEDITNLESIYSSDILLLEDNGSFNIDYLLSEECRRIYLNIVSGNTVSGQLDGNKYLFQISTNDHHEYIVR